MKEGNLYRPHQDLYQMKPGSDFGTSNPLVAVSQDSYQFKKKGMREVKRAAGGPIAPLSNSAVGAADPARAMRASSNMPPVALKRGGPMKDHSRRRV